VLQSQLQNRYLDQLGLLCLSLKLVHSHLLHNPEVLALPVPYSQRHDLVYLGQLLGGTFRPRLVLPLKARVRTVQLSVHRRAGLGVAAVVVPLLH
jgi:hypothetical protein